MTRAEHVARLRRVMAAEDASQRLRATFPRLRWLWDLADRQLEAAALRHCEAIGRIDAEERAVATAVREGRFARPDASLN